MLDDEILENIANCKDCQTGERASLGSFWISVLSGFMINIQGKHLSGAVLLYLTLTQIGKVD